jgi:hypothetical protein
MIDTSEQPKKCYNTCSCVLSVAIIIFITLSIAWQNFVTNPRTYNSIENLRTEVRSVRELIDARYPVDSASILDIAAATKAKDSLANEQEKH